MLTEEEKRRQDTASALLEKLAQPIGKNYAEVERDRRIATIKLKDLAQRLKKRSITVASTTEVVRGTEQIGNTPTMERTPDEIRDTPPQPAFIGGHVCIDANASENRRAEADALLKKLAHDAAEKHFPLGVSMVSPVTDEVKSSLAKLFGKYEIDDAYAVSRPRSVFMDTILGWKFKVHDHGFVRVIDYLGDDAAIVQAARVSYGKGTKSTSEDRSLIRYLIENSHTSPLEQVEIKFHIRLPIFIARQWLRHRAASANEYSGRYSEMSCDFYIPTIDDIAGAPKDNKQGRGGDMTLEQKQKAQDLLRKISDESCVEYHKLLHDDIGLARELARIGLTLNTYTEMYWKMDLHNLSNFIRLRFHGHAQKEIRDFAEVIWDIVCGFLPMASAAIKDFMLDAQKFSGPAMVYLQSRIAHPRRKITVVPGMSRREKKAIDALFPKKEAVSFFDIAVEFITSKVKS